MSRLRALALVGLVAAIAGCAGSINPRLAAYSDAGYRYANVRGDAQEEELFVILAFSGAAPAPRPSPTDCSRASRPSDTSPVPAWLAPSSTTST